MSHYRSLSHTADCKIQIWGKTLKQLCESGLEGMNSVMNPLFDTPRQEVVVQVTCQGKDTTDLLIDFLSQVLTLEHIKKAVFTKIVYFLVTDFLLEASLFGHTVSAFGKEVKAVTYHEAEVVFDKNGQLSTVLVFDI